MFDRAHATDASRPKQGQLRLKITAVAHDIHFDRRTGRLFASMLGLAICATDVLPGSNRSGVPCSLTFSRSVRSAAQLSTVRVYQPQRIAAASAYISVSSTS